VSDTRTDLMSRLAQAERNLDDRRLDIPRTSPEWLRLGGKADGVRLAMSYAREMPTSGVQLAEEITALVAAAKAVCLSVNGYDPDELRRLRDTLEPFQ